MTPLTSQEFATVQRFCQMMSEKIASVGLDVHVETNFRDYIRMRRELSPGTLHNPTYDPDHSALTFHNSFWLRAVNETGETVAMSAQRFIDTDCFYDELTSMRLWHDRSEPPAGVLDIVDGGSTRHLSGRVGHTGGLWINPNYRKKNLSGLLDHLGRGLLLKNFWFDHITAVITNHLAATGIAAKQYGWPAVEGRVDFDFFLGGPLVTIGLCHMSRPDLVERMDKWLLLSDCNSVQELDEVGKVLVD